MMRLLGSATVFHHHVADPSVDESALHPFPETRLGSEDVVIYVSLGTYRFKTTPGPKEYAACANMRKVMSKRAARKREFLTDSP